MFALYASFSGCVMKTFSVTASTAICIEDRHSRGRAGLPDACYRNCCVQVQAKKRKRFHVPRQEWQRMAGQCRGFRRGRRTRLVTSAASVAARMGDGRSRGKRRDRGERSRLPRIDHADGPCATVPGGRRRARCRGRVWLNRARSSKSLRHYRPRLLLALDLATVVDRLIERRCPDRSALQRKGVRIADFSCVYKIVGTKRLNLITPNLMASDNHIVSAVLKVTLSFR